MINTDIILKTIKDINKDSKLTTIKTNKSKMKERNYVIAYIIILQ